MESDAELRRHRVDIHALAVGFAEPASAHKMRCEFSEDFGDEVPFRKFGYLTFEAFLDDHPDLQQVLINGEKCYRAKLSSATADIQSLVARQRQKTDNKRGNRGRNKKNPTGPFQKPSMYPSPVKPMKQKAAQSKKAGPITAEDKALLGKTRILAALKKCSGRGTLAKLNAAYQLLFGRQMNRQEMTDHFGNINFGVIYEKWLSDEMEITAGLNGEWIFVSKETIRKQKEWDEKHKDSVISHDDLRIVWDKPTVKELFDKVVAMMVNMHPTPLPIVKMSEIYKRAHGVHVDPEALYSKNWEELVRTTFSEKILLKQGEVILTPKALQEHQKELSDRQNPVATSPSKVVKRVTAVDLGLECSDESDDSDDDDEEDKDAASDISSMKFTPQASLESLLSSTVLSEESSSSFKENFHGKAKPTHFGQVKSKIDAFHETSTACDATVSSTVPSEKQGLVVRRARVNVVSAAEFEAMKRERRSQQNNENSRNFGRSPRNGQFRPPSPRRHPPPPRPALVFTRTPIIPAVVRGLPESPRGSIRSRISFVPSPDSTPRHSNFRNEKSPSATPKKAIVWTPEKAKNKTNQSVCRIDTNQANRLIERSLRESPIKSPPKKSPPETPSPMKITLGNQGRRVSLESPAKETDSNGNKTVSRFSFARARGSGFGCE